MTSHTANTHLASVSGLSGVQSSLSLNVANSTRVLAPPAITTVTAVTTADEQFVDGRDIASMGLGSALNVVTTNIAAAFFNPRASSLTDFAFVPNPTQFHFDECRPSQGLNGWQLPQGTAAAQRPAAGTTYDLQGIPGQNELLVSNTAFVPANSSTQNMVPLNSAFGAASPGDQGNEFGASVFVTNDGNPLVITVVDNGGGGINAENLRGRNVLPSNNAVNAAGGLFGDGNPAWSPGMYISDVNVGGVAGVIEISDANDQVVAFPATVNQSTAVPSTDRATVYAAASFMVDQSYDTGSDLNAPVSKVAVTLNAGDATPAFLSFGPDTAANARRLHDMIFGSTEDRSESKSTVLTMNTLSVNAATDFFFGNTQEVAGVVQPADPDTEAVWVSWSEDLEAANDPTKRLQGVEVSSNAATTQYHIRMLAEWRADDGRMRFSVVDREAL